MKLRLHVFEESFQNLWRHRTAHLIAGIVVALTFFVLGGFWVVISNLAAAVDSWRKQVRLEVFLEPRPRAELRRAVERALRARPEVLAVRYIDPVEANRRFRAEFAALSDLLRGLQANPLPASVEATLDPSRIDAAQIDALALRLLEFEGVSGVQFDLDWLEKLSAFLRLVRLAGMVVVATLLLTSLAATAGVIQLSVLSRRDEIEILHLIGAPQAAITGPFLIEGAMLGGLAAGAGLAILALVFQLALISLASSVNLFIGFLRPEFLGSTALLIMILLGTAVGALGSLFSVRSLRP
jgi:cell division transport system permease protein